jgi:hypothetical protein
MGHLANAHHGSGFYVAAVVARQGRSLVLIHLLIKRNLHHAVMEIRYLISERGVPVASTKMATTKTTIFIE